MHARVVSIMAGLWLLAPSFAAAQTEQDRATQVLHEDVRRLALKDQEKAAELRMNEHIEVMRRILDTSLRRLMQSSAPSWPGSLSGAIGGEAFWGQDGVRKFGLGLSDRGNTDGTVDTRGLVLSLRDVATRAIDPHAGLYDTAMLEWTEGSYLKGYGIVFSASLPVHSEGVVAEPAKPARKPLSDWERVRNELRGEKVEVDDRKREESKRISLADTVLKVLAENGQHCTQLADNEQITVAVTLRNPWRLAGQACRQCHQEPAETKGTGISPYHYLRGPGGSGSTSGGSMGPGAGSGASPRGGSAPTGNTGGGGIVGPMGEGSGVGSGGLPAPDADREVINKALDFIQRTTEHPETEAQNEALLGDLHLKQGRYKDAIAAYQKAVDSHRKALENRRRAELDLQGMTSVDAKGNLKAVELSTKLAQAFLAANEPQQALKTSQDITLASEALLKAYQDQLKRQQAKPSSKPDRTEPAVPLPSKLIISASKKMLDEVGSGKIPVEEFKKAATVQRVNFSAAKKDSGKPGG